ncbi:MAG: LCP family protein [Ruminococcus sp.]|nr:LCP family protein [Ruminococcus sp.]
MAEKTRRSKSAYGAARNARSAANIQRRRKSVKASSGRRRRKGLSVWVKLALGLCVVLLLVVLAAIAVVASKISKLDIVELDPDKLSISDELTYDETGYLNVALFGLDTRANSDEMGSRSDTIMIASLNRETKEVKLCSVYRDTLLQQKDESYNKANAAYSFGEEQDAVAMLNRNLDMDINHYVTVDFSAMVDVIDALGGLDIEVDQEEVDNINGYIVEIIENTGVGSLGIMEPGMHHMNGVQATAYARIRYTQGDDFRRTERQRDVLKKIGEKAQSANLATLNLIIDRVFPKVRTNFTLPEILAYAKDVKKYELGETIGFPFEKDTMIYENAGDSVLPVDLASDVKKMHNYFYGEDGYMPSSTVKKISADLSYILSMGGGSSYSDYDTGTDYNNTDNWDSSGDSGYDPDYSGDGSGGGEWDPGYDPDYSGDGTGGGEWDPGYDPNYFGDGTG